jgi:hypothetical protein
MRSIQPPILVLFVSGLTYMKAIHFDEMLSRRMAELDVEISFYIY